MIPASRTAFVSVSRRPSASPAVTERSENVAVSGGQFLREFTISSSVRLSTGGRVGTAPRAVRSHLFTGYTFHNAA